MVSYRSIWMATWLAVGMAGIGSAPAATLNFNDEVQKPNRTPDVERRESNDPRNRPRPHEFLGTVKSLSGNVLTITLDQDDPLGRAKKGNTIKCRDLGEHACTHWRSIPAGHAGFHRRLS
jgi:hypothetical protein